MASTAFEAALHEPDSDASRVRLHELIAARNFDDSTLPPVAESYLRAFCDVARPHVRRRWIGIALAGMLERADVVAQLKSSSQELPRLGAIILSNTEQEELKIIAGIILRQCLAQSIEYSRFWSTDKVWNSAPNFPEKAGPRWMAEFQSFLDTFGDLALANLETEASIIYPISLTASDGFRWREANAGFPVAIIQSGMLTVVAPDERLTEIRFVDIPVRHIQAMQPERSKLHDSQAQSIDHEPWDLVLTLDAAPWTYQLDSHHRTGTEIIFTFEHTGDAHEWRNCIKEHQIEHKSYPTASLPLLHPMMSRSSPIDASSSPRRDTNSTLTGMIIPTILPTQTTGDGKVKERAAMGNDSVAPRSQPQPSPDDLRSRPEAASSGHRGGATQARQTRSSSVYIQPRSKSDEQQIGIEPATERDQSTPVSKPKKSKPVRQRKTSDAPAAHARPKRDSKQRVTDSQETPDASTQSMQAQPIPPIDKQTTNTKGKLPSIPQATKEKAFKQLREQSVDFDIPAENAMSEDGSSRDTSSPEPRSRARPQSQKSAIRHGAVHDTKSRRSQGKQKADDDDDFIPGGRRPKPKTNIKRKSCPKAVEDDKRPNKKARIQPTDDNGAATRRPKAVMAAPVTRRVAQVQSVEEGQASTTRQSKAKPIGKPPSAVPSSRHSLIGGLLGSQRPSEISKSPFKKPELPSQVTHASPTPSKPKTRPLRSLKRPETPVGVWKPSKDKLAPPVASPAPLDFVDSAKMVNVQPNEADLEILSSNSKPIPASPNAESTAISGHADREDVASERKRGEMQTARSDPFGQRREGPKMTSFVRRLTGEDLVQTKPQPKHGPLQSMSMEIADSSSSRTGGFEAPALSRPQPFPWHKTTIDPLKAGTSGTCSSAEVKYAPEMFEKAPIVHNKLAEQSVGIVQSNKARKSQIPKKTSSLLSLRERYNVKPMSAENVQDQTRSEGQRRRLKDPSVDVEDEITAPALQTVDVTQREPAGSEQDGGVYDDLTLVNGESINEPEQSRPQVKTPTINFGSSPPLPGSPSSHSSTSAESDSSAESSLPTPAAEEMEWEASLQPHQRALHDLLIRTSKRVMRHIVDKETAVTDIAETFAKDGEHLSASTLQKHAVEYELVYQGMEHNKKTLQKSLERAAKRLAKERKHITAV